MNWLYCIRADETLSHSAKALGRALVERFGQLNSDYASAADHQLSWATGFDTPTVEKARQELSDRGYLQQLYFDRACPVYRLQIKAADLGLKELITSGAAA